MQLTVLIDAFNGYDGSVRYRDGKYEATFDTFSVNEHSACTALSVIASLFGPGKVEPFP
ncbi:hypothetical protein AOE01nite_27870 [Acetobacter oeni]|uniref:Uncharacterized protein n=1 Tax=Acetobacter oeni TaxID=304077 RepID=A0A511XNN9_9PROT|nr:hypothetical protein AOE01nite_27870 [Acetobacter oeni]